MIYRHHVYGDLPTNYIRAISQKTQKKDNGSHLIQ